VHSLHRNGRPHVYGDRLVLRALAATFALLIAAVVLLVVGRWEQRRAARKELAGMQMVLAAIGNRIDSPTLSGYRVGPPDCLAYHGADLLLEYQLCFDAQGRLIEAVDRRPLEPNYFSLEYKPALSTIRFPRTQIDNLLRRASRG
jgi:hypothetical protein